MNEDWGNLSPLPEIAANLTAGLPVSVTILRNGVSELLFAGTFDTVKEKRVDGLQSTYIDYAISCADQHYILDKRKVAKAYIGQTISFIVNDILTEYLADEGVTLGYLAPTAADIVIAEAVFNYVPVSDVFKRIADKIGAVWYLDFDKKLYIKERWEEVAPWSITTTSKFRDFEVENHREQYRNTQYIIKGQAETDTQTEQQIADGEKIAFLLGYDISRVPAVYENNVEKLVGIKDVDTGKDYYWNEGKNVVTAAVKPAAGVVVKVVYIGRFSTVIKTSNASEIAARAFIEDNSGIYEAVENKAGLFTLDALGEISLELLRQFGIMGRKVTFSTLETGLSAGQILNVGLPEHNLNDIDLLITSVKFAEEYKPDHYRYFVTAVTGEAVGGWVEFFKKIIRPDDSISLSNLNDQVTIFETFEKIWYEIDSPNPFYTLYPSASVFPAETLYPMFHPGEEIVYMSWHDSAGVELGRKYRTSQTIDTTIIKTSTVLFGTEAIADIYYIGFWGGDFASATIGTGTLIELNAYHINKNALEILQINRTDRKGW